jgi:hypothetical protein
MFRIVLDERKKREIDPTMRVLRECIQEVEQGKETDRYTEGQLRKLHEFFETTTAWYAQVRSWPTAAVVSFLKLGDKWRDTRPLDIRTGGSRCRGESVRPLGQLPVSRAQSTADYGFKNPIDQVLGQAIARCIASFLAQRFPVAEFFQL